MGGCSSEKRTDEDVEKVEGGGEDCINQDGEKIKTRGLEGMRGVRCLVLLSEGREEGVAGGVLLTVCIRGWTVGRGREKPQHACKRLDT